jgi:predicted fused transcriptional regulator/phosphomethylpyrimidine kinase
MTRMEPRKGITLILNEKNPTIRSRMNIEYENQLVDYITKEINNGRV